MPRFAANLTTMFSERDFLDRFAAARDAGFIAVEFLFPYDHAPDVVAGRLQAAGVELALFNMPPGDWAAGERGIAVSPGREAEFRAGVATALTYAEATGVKRLHVMAGLAAHDDAAARDAYRRSVIYAAEQIGARGLDLMIEPINGRDMPGYFFNDFDYAAALIAELGLKNLKLQYDVYHRQILHGDVLKSLEALMPIVGHVQIASVPKRQEPNTGELDDRCVFEALDRLGYGGFVGCEYRPAGVTEDGLGWFEAYRA